MAENTKAHVPPPKPLDLTQQVAALEGASLCDAMHPPGRPSCRDCQRRLKRQSAILLLALLPPQETIAGLLAATTRFRRSNPMAWPSIEHGNATGLVRALKMTTPEKRTADELQHVMNELAGKVRAA